MAGLVDDCASVVYSSDNASLLCGDCLQQMSYIPDNSISLIVTDPPYHTTKKNNIINDKSFSTDDAFIEWIEKCAIHWKRLLKPNGALYVFCSSQMSARLELMLGKYFNVLNHIVWTKPNAAGYDGWKGKMKKESLRKWYPYSERILYCEQVFGGETYFGKELKSWRKLCGLSTIKLAELIGAYGNVNHGGSVSNWECGRNVPSRLQYDKICNILSSYNVGIIFPKYNDIIRPFFVNSSVEYTDVWNFQSVRQYKGKHPAEKPLDMLRHCIKSSSFENDIVLDCFAGSGNTMLAALIEKRKTIGVEIDNMLCEQIRNKLQMLGKTKQLFC